MARLKTAQTVAGLPVQHLRMPGACHRWWIERALRAGGGQCAPNGCLAAAGEVIGA
jgi:hypothetical protein